MVCPQELKTLLIPVFPLPHALLIEASYYYLNLKSEPLFLLEALQYFNQILKMFCTIL